MVNERSDNEIDPHRDDEQMAELLRLAGPRAEVPEAVEARVYAKVLEAWRDSTNKPDAERVYERVHRSWRRGVRRNWLFRWFVPAAVLATAVAVAVLVSPPLVDVSQPIATVARVVVAQGGAPNYSIGDVVHAGERIETGPGQGLSLLLSRNESLRVAENSVLVADSADSFSLERGRVYVDSGQFVYRDGGLTIRTPLGRVTDIGTQFAVTIAGGALEVAVREGRVDVSRNSEQAVAVAGERLLLPAGADARVEPLTSSDAYWEWAVALAPSLDLSNRSLLDVLKWAARESGRELEFLDPDVRAAAMRTRVHGSVSGFSPLETIDSVLLTTSFRYRLEDDRIVVER